MEQCRIWVLQLLIMSSTAGQTKHTIQLNEAYTDIHASHAGLIKLETVTSPRFLTAAIRLLDIPKYSWFELSTTRFNLSCEQQYVGLDENRRDRAKSYIQIQGVDSKLCSPLAQTSIFDYKNYSGPVIIHLYSDNYQPEFTVELEYKVASVIDIGSSTPKHEVDIEGQRVGYVVSHAEYGTKSYRENINSVLTFKNLRSSIFTVWIIRFSLFRHDNMCCDHLHIIALTDEKVCPTKPGEEENLPFRIAEALYYNVSFIFKTSPGGNAYGFIFFYVVNEKGVDFSPESTMPTLTHTMHSAEECAFTTYQDIDTTSAKVQAVKEYQATPPPGGSALYVRVEVVTSVLVAIAVLIVLLIIALRKKRTGPTNMIVRTDDNSDRTRMSSLPCQVALHSRAYEDVECEERAYEDMDCLTSTHDDHIYSSVTETEGYADMGNFVQ